MGEFLYKLGVKKTFLTMTQTPEATYKINKLSKNLASQYFNK